MRRTLKTALALMVTAPVLMGGQALAVTLPPLPPLPPAPDICVYAVSSPCEYRDLTGVRLPGFDLSSSKFTGSPL